MLLTRLLERYYGLALTYTPFVTLSDTVTFKVEKYKMVRIVRNGFSLQEVWLCLLFSIFFCVIGISGCCDFVPIQQSKYIE